MPARETIFFVWTNTIQQIIGEEIIGEDRIEYQKFERERMHSRWTKEKNPLYQAAKTTFENPTYAGGRQWHDANEYTNLIWVLSIRFHE